MAGTGKIRSIFVSDVHLGFRYAKTDQLLALLAAHEPEYLYLVGDFLDGWRLQSNWYWTEEYSQIIDRILDLMAQGTRVFYTPGNHDDFLRGDIPAIPPVQIQNQFEHVTADGRRFCVVHGDLFDTVESNSKWLSGVGTRLYDLIMWSNKVSNGWLVKARCPEFQYAYRLKRFSKRIVGMISDYQNKLIRHALEQDCQGIICGHNHLPNMTERRNVFYCNTGDWVEHSSAILEYQDGTLELVDGNRTLCLSKANCNLQRLKRREQTERRRQQQLITPSN